MPATLFFRENSKNGVTQMETFSLQEWPPESSSVHDQNWRVGSAVLIVDNCEAFDCQGLCLFLIELLEESCFST